MPREIKTTIAVDGEAAFKRAINEANTSLRNMGTQLTLAQAQFKKDGDAMKLMETRSKALKGEIDQQEEIVKALEKAVSDSSKAYGENSEKAEKWQAELNRAKAKLVNLQNELTLNDSGLDRNGKAFDESSQKAADYQATLQTIGKNVSFEAVTSGIGKITGSVENAIKMVFNLAKSIRDTMVEAGNWADELMTDAIKYKMDVETLQRWQNAADFIDTDVTTIIDARDRLGKKMSQGWKDGNIDMWDFPGVDLKDTDGNWRDQMDVMWEVGETLMNMTKIDGNDVRADTYAMQVFGKSWRELMPLFTAGRQQWEDTVSQQRVVSEDHVKALASMDDANERLANSWETLKYSFLAEIAPTVEQITDALTKLLNEFNDWMETEEGKKAMEDLSAAIQDLFSGLKDVSFKDAVETVKNALKSIKSALVWLKNNKDNVKTALMVIAGGFTLLKLGELATNIGKIVEGFKTLWDGADKKLPTMPGTDGTSGGSPTTTGGSGAGDTAVKTGIGAKLAKYLPAIKDAAGGLAVESGVIAVSVLPAVIAQKENENQWIEKSERAEEVATKAEEEGRSEETVDLLRQLNEASGPKRDETGGYKRNFLGFLDMNPTDQAERILSSLGDYKNRGLIYSDIKRFGGENDSVAGWDPWSMLLRYWGEPVKDAFGNDAGPVERNEIDELVQYLRDLQIKKLESQQENASGDAGQLMNDAVAQIKVNTESTKAASEKVAGMDLKKFNGLPADIETRAERGIQRGANGLRVTIDGETAGRILAPYVSQYIAENVM